MVAKQSCHGPSGTHLLSVHLAGKQLGSSDNGIDICHCQVSQARVRRLCELATRVPELHLFGNEDCQTMLEIVLQRERECVRSSKL